MPDLGHPQSLNRYAYVYNRPLVHVDPEGRTPLVVAAVPVVILAVAYGSQLYVAAWHPNDPTAVPGVLTGAAIYPYWETDAADWTTYDSLWLGR